MPRWITSRAARMCEEYIFPAVRAAEEADATVILVGLDKTVEMEGVDRQDLELPGYQNKLIKNVHDAAKGPVILVILSAGGVNVAEYAVSVNVAEYAVSEHYDSIIWAGYPGQEGGQAIADVVFGEYNPGLLLTLSSIIIIYMTED